MCRLLTSVLLLVVFAQLLPAQRAVTPEDYAIYAVLLRSVDRDNRRENKGKKQNYVILAEIFSNSKSKHSSRPRNLLTTKLPVNLPYVVEAENTVKDLLDRGRAEADAEMERARAESRPPAIDMCGGMVWKYFYAKHPGAHGHYQFSNVTFNRNRRRAFVEIEGTGSAWSSSRYFYLKKTSRGWMIQTSSGGFTVC